MLSCYAVRLIGNYFVQFSISAKLYIDGLDFSAAEQYQTFSWGVSMGIRSKVILSMMLLVLFICSAFLYLLYQQNQQNLQQVIEGKRASASLLADALLSQMSRNYQLRIKSFVNYKASSTREQIIKAFAERDREKLLALSRPLYQVLQEENPYFSSLGWILPDNQVFLRVHRPHDQSQNVSELRPDVAAVNLDRVQHSGFTTGSSGAQFRVVQPVFYQGQYLGVLQMGVDARQLLEALHQKLALPVGFSVPSEEFSKRSTKSEGGLACDTHRVYTTDDQLFGKLINVVDWDRRDQEIKLDKKLYVLNKILPLKNFRNELFGCVFVVMDMTEATSVAHKAVMTAAILSVLVCVITYFLLYYSFGMLIDRILNLNKSLEQSNLELEARVEERSRALLAEVEERKAVQDKLIRAEKMEAIGLMASGVAHDLNNILSGVVSYPELLLMRLPEDSTLRQPITAIKESGLRAAAVVADLLTAARDAAKVRILVNINTLILEYLQSPEAEIVRGTHPDIHIVTELDPDLPELCCSPTHVNKCIMNLVMNAAEAFDQAGTITIKSRLTKLSAEDHSAVSLAPGDYVTLLIEDDGPAIAEEDLQHIFEPFYTKKKMGRSGTGIGLAVVWNCMQDHSGSVSVQSDERQGTVFSLLFPIDTAEGCDHGNFKDVTDFAGHGEKILVVDDDSRQRDIATQILSELGYQVTAVDSGEQAIAFVRDQRVDLLVLDMLMEPGLDGCETFAEIIKIYPHQKALIVSGYSESGKMESVMELGAGDYLVKPYTVEQLGASVSKILAQS